MSADPARFDICVPNSDGSCSICGDEASPAVIESIDAAAGTAQVLGSVGASSTVALDLLDGASVGDTIMVHLGFAIERIAQGSAGTMVGARDHESEIR